MDRDEHLQLFLNAKTTEELMDDVKSLGPKANPLDVNGMTQRAFDMMIQRPPERLMKEIQALPIHLQETLAFFTYFMRCGLIGDICRKPKGARIPYWTCSCKECFDGHHQRWAEAEEKHWDLMNRFIASLNNFYDPDYDSGCGRTDISTVPIIPSSVRVFGVKQNMVLVNDLEKKETIHETAERVLIILVSGGEKLPNKVIMSGPRLTKPYPSSYIYISGSDNVDVSKFFLPSGGFRATHAATMALQSTGWAMNWMMYHVFFPLFLIRLFAYLFL